ncbi:MAG: type II secretion system protein [Cyanobacteria bacterium CRU_2_1]|nr:type II secretion system protein [Cyanobacteria bacterium RU_5_0]NJR59096.1 type II secretion system protein [Cyanobacteria bacterium CRU_2_1]
MTRLFLLSRLKRLWAASHRHDTGFTLPELLVVTAIAGGLIAGLMFIVAELTGVDQREASRSETQREMQMALDYISADLREAVYVYGGQGREIGEGENRVRVNGLQDLIPYLPESLSSADSDSIPILAFWKQHPYPEEVKQNCADGDYEADSGVSCAAGSSYALVVYSLVERPEDDDDTPWQGRSRITRYTLTEFNSEGDPVPGYVNPGLYNNSFGKWPVFAVRGEGASNRQTERPSGNAVTLVDFVDEGEDLVTDPTSDDYPCIQADPTNPTDIGYALSPSPPSTSDDQAEDSFYACVSIPNTTVRNQDVTLFLRGNVWNRPGFLLDEENDPSGPSALPTLETNVLTRGILGRGPAN